MNLTLRMAAHTRAQTKKSRKWVNCFVRGLQLDIAIGKATEGEPKAGAVWPTRVPGAVAPGLFLREPHGSQDNWGLSDERGD